MLTKLLFFISFILQTFSIPFPYKYLNSLSETKVSKEVKQKMLDYFWLFDEELENNNRTDNRTHPKPDNRTDNRTHPKPDNRTDNRTDPKPDNRTDNRTDPKPDNRTDNRTDPKPDNRTDNRTDPKPDNRTDPKPDNRTHNIELVGVNTKAVEFTFIQNISLVFDKNGTIPSFIRNLGVSRTKNPKLIEIPLMCSGMENEYTVSCVGDFTRVQNGIYIVYSYEYNRKFVNLTQPITFYVQKKSYYLR